ATIIPVLLGDVAVPKVSELPEGLHRIANLQAITIDSKHMDSSISNLIAAVRRSLDARLEDKVSVEDGLEPRRTILDWSVYPSAASAEDPQYERPHVSTISISSQFKLAVDSAFVTARPLLLVGATGQARRGIGRDIALRGGYRYYEFYCTEQTT